MTAVMGIQYDRSQPSQNAAISPATVQAASRSAVPECRGPQHQIRLDSRAHTLGAQPPRLAAFDGGELAGAVRGGVAGHIGGGAKLTGEGVELGLSIGIGNFGELRRRWSCAARQRIEIARGGGECIRDGGSLIFRGEIASEAGSQPAQGYDAEADSLGLTEHREDAVGFHRGAAPQIRERGLRSDDFGRSGRCFRRERRLSGGVRERRV